MNTTLLKPEARTETTEGQDQVSPAHQRGVMLVLDITDAPAAAETLTLSIEARDPASGNFVPVAEFSSLDAEDEEIASGVTKAFVMYPGAEDSGVGIEEQSLPLPSRWRAVVTHSGAGAWSYSLGCLGLS